MIPNGNISLHLDEMIIITGNNAAIASYVNSSYWTTSNGVHISKCGKDRDNHIIYPDNGMCSYTVSFQDGSKLDKLFLSRLKFENTGKYTYNSVISIYNNSVFQHEFFIEVNGKST